jgi:hypothetical protein
MSTGRRLTFSCGINVHGKGDIRFRATGTETESLPLSGLGELVTGGAARSLRQGRREQGKVVRLQCGPKLKRVMNLVCIQEGRALGTKSSFIFPHVTVIGCGMKVDHVPDTMQGLLVDLVSHNGLNDIGVIIKQVRQRMKVLQPGATACVGFQEVNVKNWVYIPSRWQVEAICIGHNSCITARAHCLNDPKRPNVSR